MNTCNHCQIEFKATRPWQHFCSTQCRNLFHSELTKLARKTFLDQKKAQEKKA